MCMLCPCCTHSERLFLSLWVVERKKVLRGECCNHRNALLNTSRLINSRAKKISKERMLFIFYLYQLCDFVFL